MDRILSPQKSAAGHAIYGPQFYVEQPDTNVIELTVDGPVIIRSTLGALALSHPSAVADAPFVPAPRARCIVLGSRDNRIYL
jgi:hypothetical protein